MLQAGELLPGLSVAEFVQRRQRLAETLPADSVALIPAPPINYMAGNVPYPYRPDADFTYLTGIRQANVLAAVSSATGSGQGAYTLFVPDHSPNGELWEGSSISTAAAEGLFGANAAFPMSQLRTRLPGILAGASKVLLDEARLRQHLPLLSALQGCQLPDARIRPLRSFMHRLRWKKSAAEVSLLRQAASMAADGIKQCMRLTRPGAREYQLAATFEHHCKMGGAAGVGYTPIVASGADACTIHYSRNDKALRSGDLIKMDAGCELHSYNSDITRCWPVSGSFSPQQRALYEAVLDINRQCIAQVQPGVRMSELHRLSCQLVTDALVQLGLLGWSRRSVESHRRFYPHSLAHWLGMDVHDCGSVSMDSVELEPGCVMTIEPGMYIPKDQKFGAFAGIGIRIEDDILCTADGAEVMSAGVPVEVDDIEKLVGNDAPHLSTAETYQRQAAA